jgi:hypothetical protein
MACGAEMILVTAIEDVTMPVPGFERHAYTCSICSETEQRLVFNRSAEQGKTETAAPEPVAVESTSNSQNLLQTAKRVVRLLRAKQFLF